MIDPPAQSSKHSSHVTIIVVGLGLWLLVLGYGFHWMVTYSLQPGASPAHAKSAWPEGLPFKLSKTEDTLVITLHPECACSTATLTELDRIVTVNPGLTIFAIFEDYDTLPEKTEESRLWRQAEQVPGVTKINDKSGVLAGILGSKTSGEVRLFNPHGELLYRGGITGSRGHAGANPGSDAVLALLSGESTTPQLEVPTFGCSLERSTEP